ncbi:MAG: nickel-dependent hydrogenase large subunit [Candidatus Aenigmatarchaeota archaeon]
MHKTDDIEIDQISKIEGHSDLHIKVRDGEVKDVQMMVTENKRFYTQAIRGKNIKNIAQVVSRICGTCSVAHNTCCIEAIENAFQIKPSEQTMILRNLTMNGLMIRDHALHLYIFSLPDVFNVDSILQFNKQQHKYVHDTFDVKKVGNNLCTRVAGRAVHPTLPQVGGFLKLPDMKLLKESVVEMKKIRPRILDLIDVFTQCDFKFETDTEFVGLTNSDYNFLGGEICSSQGHCLPENQFWDHLERVVLPYSQATAFEFEGEEYFVGSLARMNLNKKSLHKETQKDAAKALKFFPSKNMFHNNLSQAIEILHCIDKSTEIIEKLEIKPEVRPVIEPRMASGIGVIEAPRGTLYYMVTIKPDGKISYGNLVIPSAQNQIKLNIDLKNFINPMIKTHDKDYIKHELEKLIRAYDPCMSCAAHFLKVHWNEK